MSKVLNTKMIKLGKLEVADPEFGDSKLNVFPIHNTGKRLRLPRGFELWEANLNEILKNVPLQEGANTHYITIASDFFTTSDFQRREGPHIDGNFCIDPKFTKSNGEQLKGWGGTAPRPSWGGLKPVKTEEMWDNSHVEMDWVLPYDLVIPIGTYVSNIKGGLFVVSSNVGTKVWDGKFEGEVLDEGSFEGMKAQLTTNRLKLIPKNTLVFMSSNTPHETIIVPKGERRTFMRLTLNHNYDNRELLKTA